jgi:acetyl/propionyl-CoA carboxylase alpha subunit
VPVVPGTLEPAAIGSAAEADAIVARAEDIAFPLLVKAAAGGGGRGMRRVERRQDLPAALAVASSEAASSFGDGSVYLEREVRPARHVEVQLLGDLAGRVVAIGERDCSIQRRHQKLVEEAPAPGLTTEERRRLHEFAVRIGGAAGLTNAATAEFLFDRDRRFWFLEVNTRLQVEHGVTELVTGLDIVREQIALASGRRLSAAARRAADGAATPEGHAIEVRLTAEDPGRDFAPTPGTISGWRMPGGPGVRVDSGVMAGGVVRPEYDNLFAKLLVVAADRDAAIDRLRRALDEAFVGGIQTTLPFHRAGARAATCRARALSIAWVADHWDGAARRAEARASAVVAAGLAALERPVSGAIGGTGRGGDGRLPEAPESAWRAAARRDATERSRP